MKIVGKKEDSERREVTVTIGHVGADVVSVQDKGVGEFMVLYETADGLPSARIIAGLRQLADQMERGRNGAKATQPGHPAGGTSVIRAFWVWVSGFASALALASVARHDWVVLPLFIVTAVGALVVAQRVGSGPRRRAGTATAWQTARPSTGA